MRVPCVTVLNHELLGQALDQRVRNVLLLDHAFDIREFRVEQHGLVVVNFGLVSAHLFDQVAAYDTAQSCHSPGVMQPYIALRLPFISGCFVSIVVAGQVIEEDLVLL